MTRRQPRRDVFRCTPFFRGAVVCALVIGLAGVASQYRVEPGRRKALTFYGLLTFSVISALGVAQTFRGRIELREDEIRVVGLVGHRTYPRTQVQDARWEKGCPVSLKLADGTWAHLPDTGHANTKVAGAIRAWLNERG
jgi:hypothetical protein